MTDTFRRGLRNSIRPSQSFSNARRLDHGCDTRIMSFVCLNDDVRTAVLVTACRSQESLRRSKQGECAGMRRSLWKGS
eukprot:6016133-Pleurochrysis_carterae.AAC.1